MWEYVWMTCTGLPVLMENGDAIRSLKAVTKVDLHDARGKTTLLYI
jgi:hypothetical protein